MFKELEKLDVKEVPRWVGTYVRSTLKDLLDGSAYRGRRGRRGAKGDGGDVGTDGPTGETGASGKRGPTGAPGSHGKHGDDGIQGKRGVQGVAGLLGRIGDQGPAGTKGDKGDKGGTGDTGPAPRHKWEGTRLSFEQPNGTFGRSVNLQGVGGGRGASGKGSSANPGFSSIALVGTDLVFTRDKAGPLGPDITVDLSGLNTGGGFAGLGVWRYRTNTGTSPTSGRLNFNNVDPELATELYINETNDGGEDLANFLALLEAGDVLYIQDKGNADNFVLVEVSSNTDNGSDITIGIANVAAQGAAINNNAQVSLVISVAGGGVGSVVTGLVTAGDGDDITLTQTAGGNQVADTSDFFWRLGKPGGQLAYGSTLVDEHLDLTANPVAGTNLGRIRMGSAVEFLSISATGAPYAFNYDATESYTAAFVGGGLNMSGDITFSASTMIYESFRGAPTINTAVNPGFAAYTVLQALPALIAGAGAGHNPLAPLVLNAGPRVSNPFVGTRTTANMAAVGFSPQLQATVSGAVMNVTQINGLTCAPKYSTVAGSSINFGTIRGLLVQNPGAGLFQPGAGTESMTAYYGVDVQAIPFGGNVAKAAIRSAIVAASNARFLSNIGTAASDFGAGTYHVNDNVAAHFGNTVAAPDAGIFFDGTDLILDTRISAVTPSKVKIPYGIIVESDGFPVSDFIRRAASTNLLLSSWRLSGITSGNMADGFGTALFWSIEDDTSGRVNIAYQSCERAGADNTGLYSLRVYDAGVARQIYTASADGFAHVATNLGFYSTAPIAQPTAVPVTTVAIHAALVSLGLIT